MKNQVYRQFQQPRIRHSIYLFGSLCCGLMVGIGLIPIDALGDEKAKNAPMLRIAPAFRAGPVVEIQQDRGDWFESRVFGGVSAANARKRLESVGAQRIGLLKEQCELTDEQTSKLALAKRGDIVRFFQQVETVKQKVGVQNPDRANMAEIQKTIAPLQIQWNAGLVSPDSLFVSVLQRTLSEDQKSRLRAEDERRTEEKNRFHAMSMIKMIERSIALSDKQRKRLLELVLEQTKTIHVEPQLQQYVSVQAATKLSDDTLASFLDGAQTLAFRQLQKHWVTNLPALNQAGQEKRSQPGEEWLDVLR